MRFDSRLACRRRSANTLCQSLEKFVQLIGPEDPDDEFRAFVQQIGDALLPRQNSAVERFQFDQADDRRTDDAERAC